MGDRWIEKIDGVDVDVVVEKDKPWRMDFHEFLPPRLNGHP